MRNDGYIPFEEFFPNQFKTPFSTLIWTAVYLANCLLLYWLTLRLELQIPDLWEYMFLLILIVAAALLFWLEARIYDKIRSLFR